MMKLMSDLIAYLRDLLVFKVKPDAVADEFNPELQSALQTQAARDRDRPAAGVDRSICGRGRPDEMGAEQEAAFRSGGHQSNPDAQPGDVERGDREPLRLARRKDAAYQQAGSFARAPTNHLDPSPRCRPGLPTGRGRPAPPTSTPSSATPPAAASGDAAYNAAADTTPSISMPSGERRWIRCAPGGH